jgi:putative ABC transport system ATP-binding protein
VDLCVQRGELLALTGPSGSGKSTILNLCGLIDTPDSGAVVLGGKPVNGLDEVQRTLLRRDALGFVFQSFNLVPVMTVAENVDYPLFIAGVPAAERRARVSAQLDAVGLLAHAQHRPDALSGGQRQRVAIARALVKRPRLVIADEPTASLDSHTADQMLDLMRERGHAEGAAFLIATHDARLTRRCDRVLALLDGRLA